MRRVRIQGMLTVAILVTNVIGLIVGAMLLTVAFPKPSVILDAPHWVSFGIVPGYCVLAFILGTYWLTRQTARGCGGQSRNAPPAMMRRAALS
ncbi:adenylate cyclase [Mycobacterium tuberculosis]|nr:adenylate cyclase [Mycobacterium tuberculosis]